MTGSIRWWLILLALASLALLPMVASAANLLTNGNFASFSTIGRSWNEIDEKVGTGWDYFYVDPGTQLNKLHWFSSTDFTAHFNPGGDPYELEGPNGSAQNMWSSYEFDAGIYQRVTGLTIGTVYAFDVPFVTFCNPRDITYYGGEENFADTWEDVRMAAEALVARFR